MSVRSIAILALISTCYLAPARAGVVTFEFGLSTPTFTATGATLDVLLGFDGNVGDQIETYQLSIIGSSAELTNPDFSRFSFAAANSPAPLGDWITSGAFGSGIGEIGVELGFPILPVGPFIEPLSSPLVLGTLVVDLAGIAPGTNLNVTLAAGPLGIQTDLAGTFGGRTVDSVAADPDLMIAFSEPDGVSFTTPGGVIPEPSSIVLWTAFGLLWLVRKRRAQVSN